MLPPKSAVLLRIYTEEGRMNNHRPLYEDVVLKAREAGLAGATVLRGPMGYGAHSRPLGYRLPRVGGHASGHSEPDRRIRVTSACLY